jgi:hypothetical protein
MVVVVVGSMAGVVVVLMGVDHKVMSRCLLEAAGCRHKEAGIAKGLLEHGWAKGRLDQGIVSIKVI